MFNFSSIWVNWVTTIAVAIVVAILLARAVRLLATRKLDILRGTSGFILGWVLSLTLSGMLVGIALLVAKKQLPEDLPIVTRLALFFSWILASVGLATIMMYKWYKTYPPTPPFKLAFKFLGNYIRSGHKIALYEGGNWFLPPLKWLLTPVKIFLGNREFEYKIKGVMTNDQVTSDISKRWRYRLDEENLSAFLFVCGEVDDEVGDAQFKKFEDFLEEEGAQGVREVVANPNVDPHTWDQLKPSGETLVGATLWKILNGGDMRNADKTTVEARVADALAKMRSSQAKVDRYGIIILDGKVAEVDTDPDVVRAAKQKVVRTKELEAEKDAQNIALANTLAQARGVRKAFPGASDEARMNFLQRILHKIPGEVNTTEIQGGAIPLINISAPTKTKKGGR
ncbi:MAG: SPFH domain-containing protein [Patescibacteria group bacterium]|nr:SPFH domain-containing protein [Patescibacteria group bacterium]